MDNFVTFGGGGEEFLKQDHGFRDSFCCSGALIEVSPTNFHNDIII